LEFEIGNDTSITNAKKILSFTVSNRTHRKDVYSYPCE